jgi:drug/metabolite transporter (DMT)-like permease
VNSTLLNQSNKVLYFRLVLVTLFWGGTFVAGKLAGETFDPLVTAFGRFFVASIFLIILIKQREGGFVPITMRQFLLLVAASLTGIVAYNLLFLRGLQLIEANRASLIIALNPVVIMSAAAILGMERMTLARFAGIVIALLGVGVVLTNGDLFQIGSTIGLGEIMLAGCVLSWSAYTLIGRKLVADLSPLVVTAYSVFAGCIGLAIFAIPRLGEVVDKGPLAWIPAIYLGTFGTVLGFVWYYDGVKEIGPTRSGIFINLVPGWAVLLSALFLGEEIRLATVLGGLVIVAGVMLTNYSRNTNQAEAA